MSIKSEIAFAIAKWFLKESHSEPRHRGCQGNYAKWRDQVLEATYRSTFDVDLIRGKSVLDFGCGTGGLAFLLVRLGASSVVGLDLTLRDIEIAQSQLHNEPIVFRVSSCRDKIDLPDESVDVVACFDVMEHIMKYEAIIQEWFRILRSGGKVLIQWQPWFHPWGHHGQPYLPIPWAHVFLSHTEQAEVCAQIVDMPQFKVPWWDYRDGKRVNRFREALEAGRAENHGFLNELTMRKFEHIAKAVGFRIESKRYERFSGPLPVRVISSLFTKIPGVREFFTANAVYVLAKFN